MAKFTNTPLLDISEVSEGKAATKDWDVLEENLRWARQFLALADALGQQRRNRNAYVHSLRKPVLRGRARAQDDACSLVASVLSRLDATVAGLDVMAQSIKEIALEQSLLAQERLASAEQLLERTPIRRLDPVQERLQQRMVTAVLNGTAWLSSAEVGSLGQGGRAPSNPHARANRLLSEGKVFALERAGRKEYPRYAFDALGNPYPAVREVLQMFAGWPALRVASWFESAGAMLDGKRPRELLELNPNAVVQAAREHVQGPVHG